MVKISIITPCIRPLNLPTIYRSILKNKSSDMEWIVIFDGEIDHRIMVYESFVKIKLFNRVREKGDSYASMLRNIGIENSIGDYLYYLDDDNTIHPDLFKKINSHCNENELLIFNQFDIGLKPRIINFNIDKNRPGYIDTGQIIVPKAYKHIKWDNSIKYIDEFPYITKLVKECGSVKFVDRCYTYRNALRVFDIKKTEF